jgi:hypothetical protein
MRLRNLMRTAEIGHKRPFISSLAKGRLQIGKRPFGYPIPELRHVCNSDDNECYPG